MSTSLPPENLQQLMEEAFCEGPGGKISQELKNILERDPAARKQWEEFLALRWGMQDLEESHTPSEWVQARIRQAARKKLASRPAVKVSRGWRILLSQQMVAAATVLVIVGVGLYSHYWLKEQKVPVGEVLRETEPQAPLLRKQAPAAAPSSSRIPRTDLEMVQKGLSLPPPTPPVPLGTKALDAESPDHVQQRQLIQSAKDKMQQGKYEEALEDLLDAQKIFDSEEIRELIAECRAEIRLVE